MLPLPAGREASTGVGAPPYVRHRPERTLLYQVVEEYYPAFKAHLAAQSTGLPEYVEQEFEEYLKCGRLEHGFLRVRCDSCHAEHLVAFSCKRRGFCPSCGARRMAESAALLVDEVFPEQPVRQWVLSVPYPLRFVFASRPEVMGRVLGIVYRCIATHLINKAGFSRKTVQTGAVTLIQRFGSALNLNIHFHMLFLDGVYVERPDGSLRFRWVKAPTSAELAHLTQTLARRIGRYLERQGLLERDAENSYLAGDELEAGPMEQLLGSSITYRIAVGPLTKAARCSRYRGCRRATSRSMTGSGRSLDFHCTPASRRARMNTRSSNGCAGTSAGRRSPKSACRSPQMATFDTN
jgi:ribosomal protein S27E